MRKITQDSIKAFLNEDNFKRGNTEVKVSHIDENIDSNVPYKPITVITDLLLHGNIIATATKSSNFLVKSLILTVIGTYSLFSNFS